MCIRSTIDIMLKISTQLSKLSIDRVDRMKSLFMPDKLSFSCNDGMENTETGLSNQNTNLIVNTFLLIVELLLVTLDNKDEEQLVKDNSLSYIEILSKVIDGLPEYKKQGIDENIYQKYNEAYNKWETLNKDVSMHLLLCKRAIFE